MFFEKYKMYIPRYDYRTDVGNETGSTIDLFEFLSTEKLRELSKRDQKIIAHAAKDPVYGRWIAELYECLWNRSGPVKDCICKPSRGLYVEWTSIQRVKHRVLFFEVIYYSKYEARFLKRSRSRKAQNPHETEFLELKSIH